MHGCSITPCLTSRIQSTPCNVSYSADGALYLPGVLDRSWIERLKESVEELEARERRDGPPDEFFSRTRLWERDQRLRAIVFESPAAGIAAQVLGVDSVRLLYDQLFIKAPATNVRTPWHNDLPNWPVRGTQLITVWVALDTIGAANGRLEFLRESHRWDHWVSGLYADVDGRITHFYVSDPETESQQSLAADYAELLAKVDQHEILSWDTQPGDAVVFHALTIHGATGNAHPKHKRRSYSMRFAGPDVCYYAGPASNVGIMSHDLASGDPLSGEQYPVVYQVRS